MPRGSYNAKVVYRAAGSPDRPPGLYRNGVHIARWPWGVPAVRESTERVAAVWLSRDGMHRPLTEAEVRDILR